jgi:hypothetical protein
MSLVLLGESLLHEANLTSKSYRLSGVRGRLASLIQNLKFSKRPCSVFSEVMRLNLVDRALFAENRFFGLPAQKTIAQKARN